MALNEAQKLLIYAVAFAVMTLIGTILYRLLNTNAKKIKIQVPLYPFFQSAGSVFEEKASHSPITKDTSSLYAYLINIDQLTSFEFENMVVDALEHKGWTNLQSKSNSNNSKWDIAGLDDSRLLTYVGVLYSDEVGLSSVQEFNAKKLTGKSQRTIMVTNSKFSDQAIEYAREVNIDLIDGQAFRELCQHIIDDAPRLDQLTRPINQTSIEQEIDRFIDQAMFSYPKPSSAFITKKISSKIIFTPYQFYPFRLWQQFSNHTRSWMWDMEYPDHILINHHAPKWHVIENHQQSKTTDLASLAKIIEKEGLDFSILPSPQIITLPKVKEIIQQTTTVEKSFKGQNNQQETKICTAELSNIDVRTSTIFWGSHFDTEVKIGANTEIKLQLHEGTVSQVLNQDLSEKILNRTTMLCQECQSLIIPVKYFRDLDYCETCGKVLCEKCGHTESKFGPIKSHWCSECWAQINQNAMEKKKNIEVLKKLKRAFYEWQMS